MKDKSIEQSETQQKIVILWTAPRCVSTAFQKAFSQRQDGAVLFEPFRDVYYYSRWRSSDRFGHKENRLDYGTAQVIERIKSQTTPVVFIKEMAYQALPYIDREFMEQPLINTFLVRNPKKSLLSWYKLNEFPTAEEFGFERLGEMWKIAKESAGDKEPIIIEADSLQRAPSKTLRAYCQGVGIEFAPEMLSWEEGGIQEEKSRKADMLNDWHETLFSSKGILPPTKATGEIRSEDMPMLDRAMKTYEALSQLALK